MQGRIWTLWCFATAIGAMAAPVQGSGHEPKRDARQALEFRLIRDNLILVQGRIGSLERVNILLDTGTSRTIVDETVERGEGSQVGGDSLRSIGGRQSVGLRVVSEIEIGAIVAKNWTVVAVDLKPLRQSLGIPIVAVAGLDLLRTKNFMVDYAKKRITFDPLLEVRHEVRFEKQEPALLIRAAIEGHDYVLLLDNGAARVMLFAARVPARFVEKMARCEGPRTSALVGQSSAGARWYRANHLNVGDWAIPPQEIAVIDSDEAVNAVEGVDGLLSVAMLGARRVWFDFQGGRFLWE